MKITATWEACEGMSTVFDGFFLLKFATRTMVLLGEGNSPLVKQMLKSNQTMCTSAMAQGPREGREGQALSSGCDIHKKHNDKC